MFRSFFIASILCFITTTMAGDYQDWVRDYGNHSAYFSFSKTNQSQYWKYTDAQANAALNNGLYKSSAGASEEYFNKNRSIPIKSYMSQIDSDRLKLHQAMVDTIHHQQSELKDDEMLVVFLGMKHAFDLYFSDVDNQAMEEDSYPLYISPSRNIQTSSAGNKVMYYFEQLNNKNGRSQNLNGYTFKTVGKADLFVYLEMQLFEILYRAKTTHYPDLDRSLLDKGLYVSNQKPQTIVFIDLHTLNETDHITQMPAADYWQSKGIKSIKVLMENIDDKLSLEELLHNEQVPVDELSRYMSKDLDFANQFGQIISELKTSEQKYIDIQPTSAAFLKKLIELKNDGINIAVIDRLDSAVTE